MSSTDVGTLRTRLSWEDDGASRSMTGFRQDLKSLRSEMNVAKSGGQDYTKSLKGLGDQSDILTRRFKTQQEQVKELKRRYDESVRVKGEDDRATKNLSDQYNNAVAAMNKTEDQLNDVTKAIENQKNPWKKLGDDAIATGQKMQDVGRSMTDFGKSYSLKVTAPIVAGGVAVFKMASDFESAFTGVEKVVDGTTQELDELKQGIRDMAKEIPASTTEIAAVAEAAGRLGIETSNIESFTRTMIDMGESTTLSSEQAATEFARFANIVGMSQDDFGRLGSTVVDLGNNLATTETEISSMALRLAGAGNQVGMTEAEIMSFAAALSSVGIEAQAGGSAFSKVMIEMNLAAEKGGKDLEAFANVAGVSANDFKKAYETDATGAILMFIEGLATAEDRGLSAIGVLDEMGITEVRLRDSLLRAAGASDVFSDSIDIGTKAWEENTALTEEAEKRYGTTESQLKIMANRVKDVGITLGESLVPAVMSAIDAAEPFIKQIESGAKAFADMDEKQQQTILKLIALVAAVGPASVVLGGLTTTAGGVLKVAGSLATTLGKAGGAGLVGRLGLLGMGGPVGLAVAGVAALGVGIYALTRESKDNTEETLNSIRTRKEEIEATDEMIGRFEVLQNKNKLSTDEVLRYMDIMSELKDAKGEETIKKLSDEQATLLEKSGLTNEEIEEFLQLNGKIAEEAPATSKAISEQGNAYVEVLDAIKELNQAELERLAQDTYRAITEEMDKQAENLEKQQTLQDEIAAKEEERIGIQEEYSAINEEIKQQDLIIAGIKDEMVGKTHEEQTALAENLIKEEEIKSTLEGILGLKDSEIEKIDKTIGKKQESLGETEKELGLFGDLLGEYEAIILSEANITAEKGKGLEAIGNRIEALQKEKNKLDDLKKAGEVNTAEYQDQVGLINEQIGKLETAKGELEDINKVAGRKVYKDVDIKESPSGFWNTLDTNLGRSVSKTVNVLTKNGSFPAAYADGTSHHPGGSFLAGEEGYELGRMGNKWEMLNFGMYDRPSGYQVFTHDESKKILGAMNKMPAYAGGVSPSGEADRVADLISNSIDSQLSQSSNSYDERPIQIQVTLPNGRILAEAIYQDVERLSNRDRNLRRR